MTSHRNNSARVVALLPTAIAAWGMLASPCMADEPQQRSELLITDMSRCTPAAKLAKGRKKAHWQLISYEGFEGKIRGTMLGAGSIVEAPDVTLPLDLKGWYSIYIGLWNPVWANDGDETVVKLKLTRDPCFRIVMDTGHTGYRGTQLAEHFWRDVDLTGQDLVIGQRHTKKSYVAYVRLVPLSDTRARAIQEDRARVDTRVVIASHDGNSFVVKGGISRKEDVWSELELYRHSDVKRVTWAVNSGERADYESKVGRRYEAGGLPITPIEKKKLDAFKRLIANNIDRVHEACEHTHRIGRKFDAQFRLGILGGTPPGPFGVGFVADHPELRIVAHDGTSIQKASYAFPAVRKFMLDFVREAATKFDVDGVTLNFIRGPDFVGWEKPVLADFQKAHGEDARKLTNDDERLQRVRARYLTLLVRGARAVLDEVGKRKGKRLELSVMTYGTFAGNLFHGLDIKTWLKEGLLDSVLGAGSMLHTVKAHNCKIYIGVGAREQKNYVHQWKHHYPICDGYWVWDMNFPHERSEHWAILSRMGHNDEMAEFAKKLPGPTTATHRLRKVGGFEVYNIANQGKNKASPEFLFLFTGG